MLGWLLWLLTGCLLYARAMLAQRERMGLLTGTLQHLLGPWLAAAVVGSLALVRVVLWPLWLWLDIRRELRD